MDYKNQVVNQIITRSTGIMNSEQQRRLSDIISIVLYDYDITLKEEIKDLPCTIDDFNEQMLNKFIICKSLDSLSINSLKLYRNILRRFINSIDKKVVDIKTDDIRYYLLMQKTRGGLSNTSLNNVKSILSSFFTWLENEEYIVRNPVSKISRIKNDTIKEEPFTDSEIETLRIGCTNIRDRTILEFLLSTGCRVAELCSVNRNDIDFITKELKVIGKGNKERTVYLSDKCIVYLKLYLKSRHDNNKALFVSKDYRAKRLSISGIENILKDLGNNTNVVNVHPHRFRRTLCCNLITRGMHIEDVKVILGHSSIDTTMIYYNSNQNNIRNEFQNKI